MAWEGAQWLLFMGGFLVVEFVSIEEWFVINYWNSLSIVF